MVKKLASTSELGASLMFDFGEEYLDIMKNGGKTVLSIYEEKTDSLIDEIWTLETDKFVCESKNLSLSSDEYIAYMDEDICENIDVFLDDTLRINVSVI
jgi:hypothetical protein